MAKIDIDVPAKNGQKFGPQIKNSRNNSVIQISKPKATTRNHIKAPTDSHHPISIQPKKVELKLDPLRSKHLSGPKKTEPNRGTLSKYSVGPQKVEPKPHPLRRYSIGPEKINPKICHLRSKSIGVEKIDPKPGQLRRFSTGNPGIKISEPKPIPNYLKASTGSCHDICKYGGNHEFRTKSRPFVPPPLAPRRDQNVHTVQDERSARNYKGIKALPRKQSCGTKNTFTAQLAVRQPNKTFLKKSTNIPNSKTSLGSSVKNHGTKNTSFEDVPEKIIHVIEPKDEYQSTVPSSRPSSNENHRMDLSAENRTSLDTRSVIPDKNRTTITTGDTRFVIPDERDYSYRRKLKFWRGKLLEMENGKDGYMEKIRLRRVVCNGKFVHNVNDGFIRAVLRRKGMQTRNGPMALMNTVIEETATKLVEMRRSKVEALVGAFECVINLQDTESSGTSSTVL